MWGSCTKIKIESLFIAQKKAIRAIMPGFVNYFYMDGILPSHIKAAFTDLKILSVRNIILKKILIFINKIHVFPHYLPKAVRVTISPDSPSPSSNSSDNHNDWFSKYSSTPYNTSIFFKGPLLYTSIMSNNPELDTRNTSNPDSYKTKIKAYLVNVQKTGDSDEWSSENVLLTNLPGIRKSTRLNS